ncbi:MFS transporter [Rhodovastum atsumiense]|uniref:MFS transporter n=1 Tax=Rhodovastum atsumiense TaxID=504468 RepID=A0A5M6ILK7_9PROT|nr:MFS transporter [Rhodovastum atsumiense]KAA5609161.1 MFS transporter [Rhodovastum atsumiense]CAH2601227.1 MFS transporter [Rhodovastum atsumiense]
MPQQVSSHPQAPARRVGRALDWLNFVLADVRDGLGPYLAVYLVAVRGPQQGWNEASAGLVMTIAGVAGLLAQIPAGALIDRTRHKRLLVIAAAVAVTLGCLALPFADGFATVAATQALAGAAGAVFPPAIAALTLGLVGPRRFSRRVGRNEACNHAGNAASAALAAATAVVFGPVVVFWIMAILAGLSIVATLMIPPDAIDHVAARGLAHDAAGGGAGAPSGLRVLLANRALLTFAVLVTVFHLANAAMLPSVGQLLAHVVGKEDATSLVAGCIVAAQCVMVPVAAVVGARADAWGRKPILLAGFGVLAVRGLLYPVSDDPVWLMGVQLLDGVGAGIMGALFPVVVADLTRGTGRFNVSQGAIATAQGLGAALSTTLAGTIIVTFGYGDAFLTLGVIAVLGCLGTLFAMPETREPVGAAAAPGVTPAG